MAESNISIEGLDRVLKKLNYTADQLRRAMITPMKRAMYHVKGSIPPYPVVPAGSTYSRTGLLGRSYKTRVESRGSNTVGVLGTAVSYSPYVVDEEQQVWYNRHWYTLQKVVRDDIPAIVRIFAEWVGDLLTRKA